MIMAEKEGFEPSNRVNGYTISSRAPSAKLGDFSTYFYSVFAAENILSRLRLRPSQHIVIKPFFVSQLDYYTTVCIAYQK